MRIRNQHTTRAAATPPVAAFPDRACAGANPEIFFPAREANAWEALAFCDICPHQQTCLEWALDSEQQFGIWGGTTADERLRMIRHAA